MPVTSNYSHNDIVVKKENSDFLNARPISSSRSIEFKFKVNVEARDLHIQAATFADNYRSHGYINFYKVLRCRENQVWEYLYLMFIYSYVKCLHNACFYSDFNEQADQGYAFSGHSRMYHILRFPVFSRSTREYITYSIIEIGDEISRKVRLAMLVKNFPQLKPYKMYTDTFGQQPFLIPDLEYKFDYLKTDYYAVLAEGNPEKTVADQKDDANTKSNLIKGEQLTKGRVEIVKVNDEDTKKIIMEKNIPLTNAFMNEKRDTFYYIPVNGTHKVVDNASVFFCRGCFIDLSDNTDMIEVNELYCKSPYNNNKLFFVCSEVYTITGIKCKFTSLNPQIEFTPFTPPKGITVDFKRLYKYISEQVKYGVSILDMVDDYIKKIELEVQGETKTEGKK